MVDYSTQVSTVCYGDRSIKIATVWGAAVWGPQYDKNAAAVSGFALGPPSGSVITFGASSTAWL